MPGPSPEEMGIKKEDLSPRDRLMMMKKGGESKKVMDNLAKVFGDIGEIQQAISDLEKIANASPALLEKDGFINAAEQQRNLQGQYEQIITDAEQGKLNPEAVKSWISEVDRIRGGMMASDRA